ncbi:hypothetical protein MMC07_002880 [Pseudocyphellaria aurata]|nr:hypothetical protein [Pseudocyphellaria aurata]
MPREAEPSINERTFILQALQENIRLDGRSIDAYRPLEISFGEDYGAVDVRLGKTRVLVRASASVTAPSPDRRFDGIFTISTEVSPLASPAFEVGRSTHLETHLSHVLDLTLRRSSALPTESLCLLASRSVWSLLLTVHILAHDGSLLPCASIAALAALAHFRLPATSVRGEEVTVYGLSEREPVPLSLLHWPICLSIWTFADSDGAGGAAAADQMLLDATLREEQVCAGAVLVAANGEGEVCLVQKQGGVPTDARLLLRCVDAAVSKVKELAQVVKTALELDAKKRDRGGILGVELRSANER